MQEKKKKKMKTKASSLPDISILKTFMKTYERHCALSQSSVSVTIKQSLKRCLGNEIALTKFVLTSSENSKGDVQPVSLTPLLRTIRDERYMLGKELCVWGIQLSNQDIANLALLLEQDGCTTYPFCSLEIIHTVIDAWSVERLGAALPVSNLSSIVLDYTKFGDKRINGLVSGLKGNRKLLTLSLCYCNLGPESGTELGPIVAQTAICNLYLNGNNLQCLGALELIKPIAVYANNLARDKETNTMKFSNATGHQMHEGSKKRKKNPEIGSWLVKLRLADNGIDGRGKGGQNMVLEFTQFLIYLIKYSEHLMELDLDGNAIGELCSADVKDALKERLNAKMPNLTIKVTYQISSETFGSIFKNGKKSKSTRKKKKKVNLYTCCFSIKRAV
ncbi:PREDICTED: uncharacterized protein LOC109308599 isoform X4 [Crocodylus porosus]|uniref:uncharacterized protein LOC109308599 isoform X4 n=1 Tax=Crocodylus porosus TaxID=8502 RepID=UPI0009393A41|nr:PREDICTED: uncharacterized protein LOC109308599 isoform X4 [Crocodylus porosus]